MKRFSLLMICIGTQLLTPLLGQSNAAEPPLSSKSLYQSQSAWSDDNGKGFKLSSLRGHPVVMVMFFTQCKVSCPLVIGALKTIHKQLPEAERRETRFVLVSMDVDRDTAPALHRFRKQKDLNGEEWVLLGGNDDGVSELAMLLGMKIKKTTLGQFAHSNLITVLNKEGEIAFQRTGLSGNDEPIIAAISAATH